jgi:hypothetical protein
MTTLAPHHPACFCEQCRGVPYWQWVSDKVFEQPGYQERKTAREENTMDLKAHRSTKTTGKYVQRPFLKAKDIPAKGCTAKVIEMREAPKQMEYSDFLLDLTIGKKEYTWGLRSQSMSLDQLIDTLGTKTEKWAGKSVKLVRGGPKGQYVNVG